LLDLSEDFLNDVEIIGQPLGVDPSTFRPVNLADDPSMGLDQDLAVLGESSEQEVAPP